MAERKGAPRLEDFPGIEALAGQKPESALEVLGLMFKALLEKAVHIEDPVKKKFLETICNSALRCQELEPKAKAYVCAVGGLKDDGRLQEFMHYTTALLEDEQGFTEPQGRQWRPPWPSG